MLGTGGLDGLFGGSEIGENCRNERREFHCLALVVFLKRKGFTHDTVRSCLLTSTHREAPAETIRQAMSFAPFLAR